MNKICFKCDRNLDLSHFYKHPSTHDGRLNKCKDCSKSDTKANTELKNKSQDWVESERLRGREKYHRLGNKKQSSESKKITIKKYNEKYPEKLLARMAARRIKRGENIEAHHWSYNEVHYKDVILIFKSDHSKVHRFLCYEPISKLYLTVDGFLLSTRLEHENYLKHILTTKI